MMKITKVTFTGADDSIMPFELIDISEKYPFVEWALLASRNSQGHNRFPSVKWLDSLYVIQKDLHLSLHLCGAYVKEILMGSDRFNDELGHIVRVIDRVQINTHGYPHQYDPTGIGKILTRESEVEFIFQNDGVNDSILDYAAKNHKNVSTLFDLSHGAGISPKKWPKPILGIKCGYAGGLSPSNIASQLQLINEAVGDSEIWIDMETHVRSDNDQTFDLKKVNAVLEICEKSGLIK